MKKLITNFLVSVFKEATIGLPKKTTQEITHNLFAYIGVERMEKILEIVKEKGIEYISLAELYSLTIRDNLEAENSDRMHAYYELLPKLDEYKKAFDLKDWEERKSKRFI